VIGRRVPRVKVCCVRGVEEARLAFEAGVDAIGLASSSPSRQGGIDQKAVAEVAALAPPNVATFLLTSLIDADAIVAQHAPSATTTIQLCERVPESALAELRQRIPEVAIVQVIRVHGRDAVDDAARAAPHVDALLLDAGEIERCDWTLSGEIRAAVEAPVILAGELDLETVRGALERVEPWSVEVCNGVRTGGRLDRRKLLSFLGACGRPHPS
jgi:phosphoribosylanthranilate isomerase